jgi:hypothetical protein
MNNSFLRTDYPNTKLTDMSTDSEVESEMWYIYMMEYYSEIKKDLEFTMSYKPGAER